MAEAEESTALGFYQKAADFHAKVKCPIEIGQPAKRSRSIQPIGRSCIVVMDAQVGKTAYKCARGAAPPSARGSSKNRQQRAVGSCTADDSPLIPPRPRAHARSPR